MTESLEMIEFAESALKDIQFWRTQLRDLEAKPRKTKKDKEKILELEYEIELIEGDLKGMGF